MDEILLKLKHCEAFEWDNGNSAKNWAKHKVKSIESEQAFFNHPLVVLFDSKHSDREERYLLLGQTNHGRLLTVIFTLRGKGKLIRVISARDMSKKERKAYEKKNKKTSKV